MPRLMANLYISLSLSLSLTHTHTHTPQTHKDTNTHTNTQHIHTQFNGGGDTLPVTEPNNIRGHTICSATAYEVIYHVSVIQLWRELESVSVCGKKQHLSMHIQYDKDTCCVIFLKPIR